MPNDSGDFWFNAPQGDLHNEVTTHVRTVRNHQTWLVESWTDFAQLYSNRSEIGLQGLHRGQRRSGHVAVTENGIKSTIDTAQSLIARTRPKASVMTDGASFDLQMLAKQLEKYALGQFQALKIWDEMVEVFRDACIFGTGCLDLFDDGDDFKVQRFLVCDLVVDEHEVPSGGMPRSMHRVHRVAKEVAKEEFPDFAGEIDDAGFLFTDRHRHHGVVQGMVEVLESIHLPGKGTPGRRSFTITDATLSDEEYSRPWFPWVIYHWSPPVTGFYGAGIAEQLLGHQLRLNELGDYVQACQDTVTAPKVWVEFGGKVVDVQMTNEVGQIVYYSGAKPIHEAPVALSSDVYNERDRVGQKMLEEVGISRMAAQATRPEGIEAAVALRELSDNQSQRLSISQQRWEGSHVEVAQKLIEMAKERHSGGGGAPRAFLSKSFVDEIDWGEVDFGKHRFVMSVHPSSSFSQTPAARQQTVIEFAQYGVQLSQAQIIALLDHPDLENFGQLEVAQLEHAQWVVSQLARRNPVPPESFQDLALVIEMVSAAYLSAQRAGAPEDVLHLMREYVETATDMLAETQPPAPAEGAPGAAGATGELPPGPDNVSLTAGALEAGLLPPLAQGALQ